MLQAVSGAVLNEVAIEHVFADVAGTAERFNPFNAGDGLDPLDHGALERTLRNIVELWKSERLAHQIADAPTLRKFDRRALTGELASILDAVSVTNPGGRHDG